MQADAMDTSSPSIVARVVDKQKWLLRSASTVHVDEYVTALSALCADDDALAEDVCVALVPALWSKLSAKQREVRVIR